MCIAHIINAVLLYVFENVEFLPLLMISGSLSVTIEPQVAME